MAYQELVILLPCHSLEDFPTHYEGDDAEGLLSCWTTLWHPSLIASAGQAPQWYRVDDPPNDMTGRLIAIPNVCKERLPTGYTQRAKEAGATLLRNLTRRADLLRVALEPLGPSGVSEDLAADFLALGYAYLEIQLLTRQMRYSSSLDDVYFKDQVVAAAQAAVSGDEATSRERLSACFSLLAEERDRYYPVDAYLLDLTMVAETTLGASFREELQSGNAVNLLIDGELLEQMAAREPESVALLRDSLGGGNIGLIGGEDQQRRLPLLSLEDIRQALLTGTGETERHLGVRPSVFGRRRFGLSSALPQLLHKTGFRGAVHATLEEGRFPEGTQLKVGWEGTDGTSIDAIARAPLDASQAKTFLQLATKLGESMDQDHVATLLLAHWPGQASPFYEDLRRTAKYSPCFGRFATIDQYFEESSRPGQMDRFEVDRYKSPYLKQAVIRRQPDPLSSVARYWKRRATFESIEAMEALASIVAGRPAAEHRKLLPQIVENVEQLNDPAIDEQLQQQHQAAARTLADVICAPGKGTSGYLFLNPYGCVRRTVADQLQIANLPEPEKNTPWYAVGEAAGRKQAVVDVPAFGFAWLPAAEQPIKHRRPPKLLAESPNLLRNEFFEVTINTTTGAIQSIHEYTSRRNRLSQQLALRTPGSPGKSGDVYRDPDESALYSIMGADSVEVTCATTALGEITVRGRLMDREGNTQATYKQILRIWRGSRVLQLDIELEPQEELKSDLWNSYYTCRFAWGDEAAEPSRSVHQQRHTTTTKYLEAPHYIEIDTVEKKTAILTGGLPFHRRTGPAMLDSLLLVRGETARKFTLGIGIDLPYPLHEAMSLLCPPAAVPLAAAPPKSGLSGWLIHLDSRNVITTHLAPLEQAGRPVGFRARLLEIAGRGADLKLSAFRDIRQAKIVDFRGEVLRECSIEEGKAKLTLSAHEYTEVEAYW